MIIDKNLTDKAFNQAVDWRCKFPKPAHKIDYTADVSVIKYAHFLGNWRLFCVSYRKTSAGYKIIFGRMLLK